MTRPERVVVFLAPLSPSSAASGQSVPANTTSVEADMPDISVTSREGGAVVPGRQVVSAAYPTFTAWRRATNPRLRRTRPTAIRETGPRRTLIDCLCGSSISYCTVWPVTRRVVVWRRQHDLSCWPDGVPYQEVCRLDPYRADPYGRDEADGAACRAMAAALAAVRRP